LSSAWAARYMLGDLFLFPRFELVDERSETGGWELRERRTGPLGIAQLLKARDAYRERD
jgi:hypothetical protein